MSTPQNPVLLTTQKNALFLSLEAEGLSPSDFTLSEVPGKNMAYIRHRFTTYQFVITVVVDSFHDETYFVTNASPGWDLSQEDNNCRDWNSVTSRFACWITCLNTQLQAPDLWATVTGDTQLIKLAADQDNKRFTPQEQLQVKKALDEIKTYLVQSQQLSQEQIKSVEGRFKYMEEAASRLGRKDYIGIVVTTLLTIAYDQGFSSDVTGDMIKFAGQIFREFLGTMLYLAGPH